jgi:hypothetical protein
MCLNNTWFKLIGSRQQKVITKACFASDRNMFTCVWDETFVFARVCFLLGFHIDLVGPGSRAQAPSWPCRSFILQHVPSIQRPGLVLAYPAAIKNHHNWLEGSQGLRRNKIANPKRNQMGYYEVGGQAEAPRESWVGVFHTLLLESKENGPTCLITRRARPACPTPGPIAPSGPWGPLSTGVPYEAI